MRSPQQEQGGVEVEVVEASDAKEALRIAEAAAEEEQQRQQEGKGEDQDLVAATTTRSPIVVAGSLYLVADVMRLARRLRAAGADERGP